MARSSAGKGRGRGHSSDSSGGRGGRGGRGRLHLVDELENVELENDDFSTEQTEQAQDDAGKRRDRGHSSESSIARGGHGGRGGRGRLHIVDESENVDVSAELAQDDALEDFDSDEESDLAVRGSNIPTPLPEPSERQVIWINGNEFSDQKSCSREITSIAKLLYRGAWGSWDDVPDKDRMEMWGRFQGVFQWNSKLEAKIKKRWNDQMKARLRDMLRRAREQAFKKVAKEGGEVGDDYMCILNHNPSWLKQQYWVPLVEKVWNTEEWKKMSHQNTKNRAKLIGGPHTCGSTSYTTARKTMEDIFGRRLSSREFYTYGHTKKGSRPWEQPSWEGPSGATSGSEVGEVSGQALSNADELIWVNESSRIYVETYQSLMIERYGEDLNNHPPHDHELWLKTCGGRKKGRLIGASDADDPIFVLIGTPGIESGDGSSCGSRQIDVQVEKLQKTVVDMEEERAGRKKEIEALEQANERERLERERIEKELNDYRAETNKKLALLFAHLEPPHP